MPDHAESAILIHGLWMHGIIFVPHQLWLQKRGFGVRRFSYPSWSRNLDDNANELSRFVATTPGARIHLVAHSLGGLVALNMLAKEYDRRIHRVVLMGTPYAGCHCGAYMAKTLLLSPLLGLSIRDWLAKPGVAVPKSVEIGVIAGTRSWGLGRAVIPGLPQPNDGVVSVAETNVPEARDSICLPVSHSGMVLSRACAEQVAGFIRNGKFTHA